VSTNFTSQEGHLFCAMSTDHRYAAYKWKCALAAKITFVLVVFTFSVALIVVGANVKQQGPLHPPMVLKECHLRYVSLSQCHQNGKWIPVFSDVVVESEYAFRDSEIQASLAMNDYPVNRSYPCMCNAYTVTMDDVCNVWSGCQLNVDLVKYVLGQDATRMYGADAAIAIGSIMLGFLVSGIVILFRCA
jgi:hypothetical protein